MKLAQFSALMVMLAVLGGCRGIGSSLDTQSPRSFLSDSATITERQKELDDAKKAWVVRPTTNPTSAELERLRNDVQDAELNLVDSYFVEYEKWMAQGRVSTDLLLDIGNLVSSAASTVTGGIQAKTVLSGISTVISGSKLAIDEDVFFKSTSSALISKMHALQSEQRLQIATRRLNTMGNYSSYTIGDAEADVKVYYEAGTIPGAIAAINKDAEVSKKQADDATSDLKMTASFVEDDPGRQLQKWMKGGTDEAANKRRHDALVKWLEENHLKNVPPTFFLHSPQFTQSRAEAAEKLTSTNP